MDMQYMGKAFMLFSFTLQNTFSRTQKEVTEVLLNAIKQTFITGIAIKDGKMTAVSHGPFSHTLNSENENFEDEEQAIDVVQVELPKPFKLTIVKNDKA